MLDGLVFDEKKVENEIGVQGMVASPFTVFMRPNMPSCRKNRLNITKLKTMQT